MVEVQPPPTEKDFENFIVDHMSRAGRINTRMLYDALYPTRFWLEYHCGAIVARRTIEEWIGKYLEPVYPDWLRYNPEAIMERNFTWRLKING